MTQSSIFRLAAIAAMLSTPAIAGDMATDFSSWQGRYVGINLGSVITRASAKRGAYSADIIALDVSNGLFPAQMAALHGGMTASANVGYNMQSGNMVYGAEIDFGMADYDVTHRQSAIDPNPAFPFTGVTTNVSYQTRMDKFATARVRAGMAYGNNYFFGTGGLAAGYVENHHNVSIPDSVAPFFPYNSPEWSKQGWLLGYTIGAGVERKVSERVSIKAEALWIDLADRTVRGEDPVAFPGSYIDYKFSNNFAVARIGTNISF